MATDNAGWFKVDFFRIHRLTPTSIDDAHTAAASPAPEGIYSLNGQLVSRDNTTEAQLKRGIYIIGGKKKAVR